MDRITRKQRQLDRKYDNLRRIAAEEQRSGGTRGLATTHSAQSRIAGGGNDQLLSRASSAADSLNSSTGDAIKRCHQQQQQKGNAITAEQTVEHQRIFAVFIAIQDFVPEPGQVPEEALPLEQGQIVEVLDNKNPANWLVRTKAKPEQIGWVPGSYFETPLKYYTQRKRTRELTADEQRLSEQQQTILKREQVFHELLRTEEQFVAELRDCLEHFLDEVGAPEAPEEVLEQLQQIGLNMRELCNFHSNVMLNGLQYYSDDPGKVGQTFLRLEPDFEQHHVTFLRDLEKAQRIIAENGAVQTFLEKCKTKGGPALKEFGYYLELVPNRIRQYEDYLKELIKYSLRIQQHQNINVLQKALELIQSLPKKAQGMELTKNLVDYPGDIGQLGRIYRHDLFTVWEDDAQQSSEKYVFLFRNKMMITARDMNSCPAVFRHYATIRLDKYTVREHSREQDTMVFRPDESGLPTFLIKSAHTDAQQWAIVRKAWLRDIVDMQTDIGGSTGEVDNDEQKPKQHQEG